MESAQRNTDTWADDTSSIAPSYTSEITVSQASVSSAAARPSTTAARQPPKYSDHEVISVRIPAADLADSPTPSDDELSATSPPAAPTRRKSSWLAKLKPSNKPADQFLMMTRGDYLRYWARDAKGNYIGTAPKGEGRRVLRGKRRRLLVHGGGTGVGAEDDKGRHAEDRFARVTGDVREPGNSSHLYGDDYSGPSYSLRRPGMTRRQIETEKERKKLGLAGT